MKKPTALLAAIVIAGCANLQPPAHEPAAAAPSATTPSNFVNVQVLPRDMPREEFIEVMRGFSRSLGVRCDFCHAASTAGQADELDFPSDAKEEKRVARVMIQMTQQINGPWLDRVEAAEGHHEEAGAPDAEDAAPRVVCWTCHRGKEEPEHPPAVPPAK